MCSIWYCRCCHYLSKPTEYTIPRVNPNVNDGLWFIIMFEHWLINCFKKCTTLMQVVSNGETGGRGKSGGFHLPHRNPLLSAQFFCKPKTAQKIKYINCSNLKKKQESWSRENGEHKAILPKLFSTYSWWGVTIQALATSSLTHWRRQWQPTPLQYSCLENPMDGGAW